MSLVLICPSTVIRAIEPARGRAKRRGGIRDRGIGLHEAEHRRQARLDHPRALRLGRDRHPVAAERAALRAAVGGHDRPRELLSPVAERRLAASATPAGPRLIVERDADRPVSATATRAARAQRLGGRVPHRQRVAVALLAGGGVGVPGVDETARIAPASRSPGRPGRARRRRRCGSEPARSGPVGVADHHADVRLATALQPAGDTGGPEARRELGRLELLDAGRGVTQRDGRSLRRVRSRVPSPSGSPSIRFRFWIACQAAPFQRLSIAANTIARPAARPAPRDPADIGVADVLTPGGASTISTNGSSP